MATDSTAKIKIRWIRSGIAFNRNQKEIIRSLGLRRLHQVVERQDIPVVRGLVGKVSHLVEVVEETKPSVWASVAEYAVVKPEPPAEASNGQTAALQAADEDVETVPAATLESVGEPARVAETQEPTSSKQEAKAPRKRQSKTVRT